ncbi:MAG: PAS domain S-box protein [Syntrophobacteraceae bacterium]
MKDEDKSKEQLIIELKALRQSIAESEKDKTERKRAEEALRESEELYRTVVRLSPDPIFVADQNGSLVFTSPKALQMFGYPPDDQVLGRSILSWVVPEEHEMASANIRRLLKEGTLIGVEYTQLKNDGTPFIAEVNAAVVYSPDGSPTRIIIILRDVTERKRARDELFNSRQMLRTVLDNIPQRVFWKDRNSVFVGCNKAFALDCGYEDPGGLVGKTSYETASAATAGLYHADDREVMESDRPKINYEEPQIRPDGSRAWLITSKIPMHDRDGQVVGVLGTYSNITERKLAEDALRQSEERFSRFFRATPVGTSITRLGDGQYADVNDAWLGLFGYTREEVVDQNPLKLGIWVDREDQVNMVRILQEQGRVKDFQTRFRWKSGKIGEVLFSAEVIEVAGQKYILGLTHDITERKRAEEELLESENKFKSFAENALVGIYLLQDGVFKYVNPKFAQMFGYTVEECLNDMHYKNLVYTEDLTRVEEQVRERTSGEVEFVHYTFRGLKKNGQTFHAEVYASTSNYKGSPASTGTILDITERTRTQEEKEKLKAQLFQAQKMESVGRLAGGVAHDFNNMLGVIIGRAELALNTDVSADQLQHNLKEILKTGLRSADLTRRLLAFARKQTAAPKILDLNVTISGMLEMLRRLVGEDIDLLWAPELNLWKVKIDPSQVDQILANLVVNARDAISGVGAITMITGNVVIDDSNRAETPEFIPGEYVLLTVSDTGAGMSQEVRENIFEPFFTTKEVGKGTGLGLSTVYGIVKQNDGFIYVASEPAKGTTFKIYLPRLEAETAQVPSEEATGKRPTGTETILLVEDDEAILNLSKIILENLGYTVLAAQAPADAIRLAEEHSADIHLLITDVVMPEMHGRELAEKLSAIRPNLKCLYISGYTADVIAHRGILDEGVNFIQKPFLSYDFAARVRQVLGQLE